MDIPEQVQLARNLCIPAADDDVDQRVGIFGPELCERRDRQNEVAKMIQFGYQDFQVALPEYPGPVDIHQRGGRAQGGAPQFQ